MTKMERKIFIYGLREENSNEYRYIGKTSRPENRLKEHLNEKIRKFSYYKLNWVKQCQENNIEILLDILEEVNESSWEEKERYYINLYKERGYRLTNLLGGGLSAQMLTYRLNYNEAKKIAQTLNIKTTLEWRKKSKAKEIPHEIPKRPDLYYKYSGWISWSDWLGVEIIANKDKTFLNICDCKKIVHDLGLKTNKEWRKYCASGLRPKEIPSNPDLTFKNNGWVSWSDWLGNNNNKI